MNKVKKYIKYGLAILLAVTVGYTVFADTSYTPMAAINYERAVEEENQAYNAYLTKQYSRCVYESELATAKLTDHFNSVRLLESTEDEKSLVDKSNWECTNESPLEQEKPLDAKIDPIQEQPELITDIDVLLKEACDEHADETVSCQKIMKGVFQADSGQCTKGVGASTLNCGNMRPGSGTYGDPDIEWTIYDAPGNGQFRKYATLRDGVFDNVALYSQLYEGTSIAYMQKVWATAGDWWGDTVRQYANS